MARAVAEGSSPLTRGKQHRVMLHQQVPGLIPTHAGKTYCWAHRPQSRWAHPHSRGENSVRIDGGHLCEGSSPLTRGKRVEAVREGEPPGLIPTHAGKTQDHEPLLLLRRAHPHSRGENVYGVRHILGCGGSSPLTRGKLIGLDDWEATGGLIPTHAGKTRGRRSRTCPARAHPHSRGENRLCD